jgi:hypothetical protein
MTKTDILPVATKERPPKFVENRRSRNACFHKRKDAFLKKAFHLSVNTDSEIVVMVRRRTDSEKPPLLFASHGNIDSMYAWFKEQQASKDGATVHSNSSVYEQYWLATPQPGVDSSASSSSSTDNGSTDAKLPLPEPVSFGECSLGLNFDAPLLLPTLTPAPASPSFAIHDLRE